MSLLLTVDDPAQWSLDIPGVPVIAAKDYLTSPKYSGARGTHVFNLCRSYRYQSAGYYVSLLAEARGHRVLPRLDTLQELRWPTVVRLLSGELDGLIQRSLRPIVSRKFTLSIYFGRNLAKRYDRLSRELFNAFPAPLLRASFRREEENGAEWRLERLVPISTSRIAASHRSFLQEAAQAYFARRTHRTPRRVVSRFDLAILVDTESDRAPSDEGAIERFCGAARRLGLHVTRLDREELGRVTEFDALFIRECTAVTGPTYRFAQRAQANGMVVIDDPSSILRCSNKVFLAELLGRHKVPTPATMVVHRGNVEQIVPTLGLPCVLKEPDSSFSQGVKKVDEAEGVLREAERMLEQSDLIVAQAFTPTEFDWRIGVIDRAPLFSCRYHMAPQHWQVIGEDRRGKATYGGVDTLPLDQVPPAVVETAVRAANLIGDGFYGVDLKEVEGSVVVIEVNDNPNVEAGSEDRYLKDELYLRVMQVFLDRLERRSHGATAS